jgi:hypothetical protein
MASWLAPPVIIPIVLGAMIVVYGLYRVYA